jgi:F-type H+-transporting ATPase subunit b
MDNPLVNPDPGLFIWTIITFLVLLILLTKFAWRPLLARLEKRRETIRQSLADAAKAKAEFEQLQRESKELLAKARAEAHTILTASRTQAEKDRDVILQDAKAKANAILETAAKQMRAEREKAVADLRADLRKEVLDLSAMLASKLIRKHITPEDDWALIEESMKKLVL